MLFGPSIDNSLELIARGYNNLNKLRNDWHMNFVQSTAISSQAIGGEKNIFDSNENGTSLEYHDSFDSDSQCALASQLDGDVKNNDDGQASVDSESGGLFSTDNSEDASLQQNHYFGDLSKSRDDNLLENGVDIDSQIGMVSIGVYIRIYFNYLK